MSAYFMSCMKLQKLNMMEKTMVIKMIGLDKFKYEF